jgi:5-methylcytosine-specific restriction endonuclease McrA
LKIRKPIPSRTKKLIFQEAQSQCPFCGESDIDVLEIHHIDNDTDNHSPENLILSCSNCLPR